MLSVLLSSWLACSGSPGADPTPASEAPVASAPQPDTQPSAPAATPSAAPWRVVVQYIGPEFQDPPAANQLYTTLSPVVRGLGISIAGARPPYGEVEVYNDNIDVIGTLNIATLPKGDYGWILAEQGRDPVVVQGLETSDGRLVVYSEIERYFGVRLGL